MLSLKTGPLDGKMDVLRFESGKQSLTRQTLAKNLKAVVVGRDGKAYETERWYESYTFRSGEQRNLLIADNRTEQYAQADADTKQMLARLAWGDREESK